MSFVRFLE